MSKEQFIGCDYAKHPDKSVMVTGIAKYHWKWAGSWYKPWTWFRYVKVVDEVKIDNVEDISLPMVSRTISPLISDHPFGQTDILAKMPPVVLNERSMWGCI